MLQQPPYPLNTRWSGILKWTGIVLVVFYLINCFTPLRLHVDTLRYFAIKDCIELGCPPDSEAAKDYLPYGYTVLLLALSKLGILKSFSIVFINCIYLAAGLYFAWLLFKPAIHPFFFFVVVLLNWTIIKFVVHPLSEMQYLFFSLGSLHFFYVYTKEKKPGSLLVSFILGGLAFITRSVGVALVPALLLALAWEYRKEIKIIILRHKIASVVVLLLTIAVLIFSRQLGLNHYTGVFSKQFQEGRSFSQIIQWHFTEWAEIFGNIPANKAVQYLPGQAGNVLFVAGGILFFAWFIYMLFFRKTHTPFVVKAYLFFYCILMFTWPFYDPRFWVPVLPLVAAVVLQTPFDKNRLIKIASRALLAVYILLGIFAIGYSTYTSLNKKSFSRNQAKGVYRNEYETHFFGKPLSDTARKEDPFVLHVLQRYD
jgi:hypothetical protein